MTEVILYDDYEAARTVIGIPAVQTWKKTNDKGEAESGEYTSIPLKYTKAEDVNSSTDADEIEPYFETHVMFAPMGVAWSDPMKSFCIVSFLDGKNEKREEDEEKKVKDNNLKIAFKSNHRKLCRFVASNAKTCRVTDFNKDKPGDAFKCSLYEPTIIKKVQDADGDMIDVSEIDETKVPSISWNIVLNKGSRNTVFEWLDGEPINDWKVRLKGAPFTYICQAQQRTIYCGGGRVRAKHSPVKITVVEILGSAIPTFKQTDQLAALRKKAELLEKMAKSKALAVSSQELVSPGSKPASEKKMSSSPSLAKSKMMEQAAKGKGAVSKSKTVAPDE